MLLVQEYLISGKTLEDLQKDHGINNNITNGKVSLNYDQIDSKETDLLAQQCRGLILEEGSWEIIACPMFRFFNMRQECRASIHWGSVKYLLKLDGTMLIIYFYKDQWYVGTRSRAEANVPNENSLTFSQITDLAIQEVYQDKTANLQSFMSLAPKDRTYVFELTSPLNQVYCFYNKLNITLIAVRDNITLKEEFPENYLKYFNCIETAESYNFSSTEDMINIINSWNPKEKEGVVVRDQFFNRIKVKNPGWEAMSHLKDSLQASLRNCVKLVLLGKEDDIIGDLPEVIQNRILDIKKYVSLLKEKVMLEYEEIKGIDNMKEFASKAEFTIWPAAMYALKRGKSPDLKHFMLGGNKYKNGDIPDNCIDNVLIICKKLVVQCLDFLTC